LRLPFRLARPSPSPFLFPLALDMERLCLAALLFNRDIRYVCTPTIVRQSGERDQDDDHEERRKRSGKRRRSRRRGGGRERGGGTGGGEEEAEAEEKEEEGKERGGGEPGEVYQGV